ncbi:MAG: 30S ribosomal protein S20 [Firmicutes bacterium]|nr:30S ribosomal protein S20 [Bacillota bacterium]
MAKQEEVKKKKAKSNEQKRLEQSKRKNLRNRMRKSKLNTQLKKFNNAIIARDTKLAESLLPLTISLIDKTAKHGVLHKNNASRKKSRVNSLLYKLQNNLLPVKVEKITKKEQARRERAAKEAEAAAATPEPAIRKTRAQQHEAKIEAGLAGRDARRQSRQEKADRKEAKRQERAEARIKAKEAKKKK